MKSLITLFFLLLWGLLAQAHAQAFAEKSFERPLREVAIILTNEGFYPETIFAYKGERVRFYLTSVADKPKCFMLQEHNVFLSVGKGEVTEAEVDFNREEKVRFHCPADRMEGVISVHEHPREFEDRRRREIASESKKQVLRPEAWMPKDDLGRLRSE